MKAGYEAHFLAGQIFTLAIAAIAILPRMPFDDDDFLTIGGNVSYPFRRALLGLIFIGIIRVIGCHFLPQNPDAPFFKTMDSMLGTIHVVGQSFLCLTTAYLLQRQLCQHINIEGGVPGRSLIPALIIITLLTMTGSILSATIHSNWWCLVNIAEAYSTLPVLKTLQLYANITTISSSSSSSRRPQHRRGPILVQILMIAERWYLLSSLLSFFGEAANSGVFSFGDNTSTEDVKWLQIVLEAFRQNQDNGIDDWTRLMMHSVFLNSIDELQHFTSFSTSTSSNTSNSTSGYDPSSPPQEQHHHEGSNEKTTAATELHPLVLRRAKHGGGGNHV